MANFSHGSKNVRFLISILAVISSFAAGQAAPATQSSQSIISTMDQIQEDFANVPCRNKERQAGVRGLFEKMGAPSGAVTIEKIDGVENLVLRQPGNSNDTIVIGAHYDFVEQGCGAVDNWTGVVILAHLYRSIRSMPSAKTLVFVAFGKEENGLLGSKAMVSAIPKGGTSQYCAMINMDSFSSGGPFAMENTSSPKLMALAREVAEAMKLPFYTVPIRAADADSSSFLAKGIPAVTLSGMTSDWQSILHSPKDQASKVNSLSVYLGYRVALGMLSKIDQTACDEYRDRKSPPSLLPKVSDR